MSYSNKGIDESSEKLTLIYVGQKDGDIVDIEAENTFFQDNLYRKKLVLKYFQADNTDIPLFIPDKLNILPPYALNTLAWAPDGPGAAVAVSPVVNSSSIDYLFSFATTPDYHPATQWAVCQWVPQNPSLTAPNTLLNQNQVIRDPYFHSHNLSHVLAVFTFTLNNYILTVLPGSYDTSKQCQIRYDGNSISLLVPNAYMLSLKYLLFSRKMNDLFQFNSYKTPSEPEVYLQIPDGNKMVDGLAYVVFTSRFISRNWVAWDTVFVQTTLPIKTVEVQTNLPDISSGATDYKRTIYALNAVENSINFYPYYAYEPSTTDDYTSFTQNAFESSNYKVSLSLYNKRNGLSLPYTLKKGEVCTMNFFIRKV